MNFNPDIARESRRIVSERERFPDNCPTMQVCGGKMIDDATSRLFARFVRHDSTEET
jgi:hypothetical protein